MPTSRRRWVRCNTSEERQAAPPRSPVTDRAAVRCLSRDRADDRLNRCRDSRCQTWFGLGRAEATAAETSTAQRAEKPCRARRPPESRRASGPILGPGGRPFPLRRRATWRHLCGAAETAHGARAAGGNSARPQQSNEAVRLFCPRGPPPVRRRQLHARQPMKGFAEDPLRHVARPIIPDAQDFPPGSVFSMRVFPE